VTDVLLKFLNVVWGKQPPHENSWVFLSNKNWDTGVWTDQPITWPKAGGKIDRRDLYFAPNVFSESRRVKRYALAGRWLYADLDEVDPRGLQVLPTLAWATSPDRYQALWLLDRRCRPRVLEELNQKWTYFTKADKGGWSLTKVLRAPGTLSTKYQGLDWQVNLVALDPDRRKIHRVEDMQHLVRNVETAATAAPVPALENLPNPRSVLRKHRNDISPRVRSILRTRTLVKGDDRSAKLWELYNELLAAGLSPTEVVSVVQPTIWNKYSGQKRELRQLWAECNKAAAASRENITPIEEASPLAKSKASVRNSKRKKRGPDLIMFRDFLTKALPKPTWLVQGIWSDKAHGMLAGESKSFKSLLTYDLAISVASGTPFLNHFPVPATGPVIIIQEENEPGLVQDRMMRIAHSRDLGPQTRHSNGHTILDFGRDLPIGILNNAGFNLADAQWMSWLKSIIRDIKPVLVVLDPLYLMTPGIDENSSVDMTPVLRELLEIKQKYNTGILIVHHFHKPKTEGTKRIANRISGSGVFHRWFASAVFAEVIDEQNGTVRLSAQHRGHGPQPAMQVEFDLGGTDDDDLTYVPRVSEALEEDDVVEDTARRERDLMKYLGSQVRDVAQDLNVTEKAVRARARRMGLHIQDGFLKED
jgi:hypothetical protein